MAANKNPIFSLNGGEISPLLDGRADLPKYRSFQKTLNNFIVEPQGAIKRRLGTVIQSRLGNVDAFVDSVIEKWVIDRTNYFQMLFVEEEGSSEIRFINQNGVQVFTLAVPYAATDFDLLYFRQLYDTMYICHPDFPVKLLSRTEQFVWTIEDAVFNGGPYAGGNLDTSSTVTIATTGDPNVTIASSNPLFVSTDVGRTFKTEWPDAVSDNQVYSATTNSTPIVCGGAQLEFVTGNTWDGLAELQISVDDGSSWQTIGSVASKNNNNNIVIRDIVEFDALARIKFTHNGGTIDWTLTITDVLTNHYVITSFTDTQNVTAELLAGEYANITASWEWALGAFSETTGFPTCVEIFNERLILAGVLTYPSDVYLSQTNVFENFQSGILSTSPFSFTLNTDIRDRVLWLLSDQQLLAGTNNSEWTISSRNANSGIAIDNINVSRQNDYGSDPIQPIRGDDTSYFVEIGGRRVRSFNYVFDFDAYLSDDMSILAPHLTEESKIVKIAFTRSPDKIVWVLLEDGTLLTFTTDKEQNVGAWSKHPMEKNTNTNKNGEWTTEVIGRVIDINSVLTDEGDIIGMVVQRQDGVYYETLAPNNNCIDAQTVFEGITQDDVLALPGDEDFTFWDDAFRETNVPFSGLGSFLRLDNTVTTLVVKYDGVEQTLGTDYAQVRAARLYWLPDAPDESLITVFDGAVVVDPGNYYTVEALDCLIVQAKPLETIDEYIILNNGTPMVLDTEYFAMTGDTQFLLIDPPGIDPDLITVEVLPEADTLLLNDDDDQVLNDDNDEVFVDASGLQKVLSPDQYEVFVPIILISIFGNSTNTAYFGLKIYSLAELVDMYNNASYGGGLGGTRRDVEADIYVVKSVNMDYTSNAGLGEQTFWQAVLFIDAMANLSGLIPSFTGKKKIRTINGYSTEANIGLRSDSPYCLTVAQIGAYGSKLSDRGTY